MPILLLQEERCWWNIIMENEAIRIYNENGSSSDLLQRGMKTKAAQKALTWVVRFLAGATQCGQPLSRQNGALLTPTVNENAPPVE